MKLTLRSPLLSRLRPVPADVALLAALLAGLNLPLLWGMPPTAWNFQPDAVAAGEWWRLLTHPFVHVSFYHLFLDGAAFLTLYAGLGSRRAGYAVGAAAGSLGGALLLSGQVATVGLCGLSGAAHGLLAVCGAEMAWPADRGRDTRVLGMVLLGGVAGKALLEVATGGALFAGFHLGDVGLPIVECHLGGVVGGLLAWLPRRSGSDGSA